MSSTLLQAMKLKRYSVGLYVFILLCLLVLTGCGSKKTGAPMHDVGDYTGAADGIVLTKTQQAIFNTSGELDKNIPADGLPSVARQYAYYLNKGRQTMTVFSKRAEDYLGHARLVFRKRGMPEELAYLAIVESGYNHSVTSHAGATGAWQFMPYTGMKYGLKQDWWLDERRDPYKSVEAAATYLQRLYGYFGDWLLALAAYNAGEGKIGRALEGTGAKDFFTLVERNEMLSEKAQLRKETKDYVPRFLAVCKIMRNLAPLGFTPIRHNKAPLHARIVVPPGTDLVAMAKVTETPWEEFKKMNLSHKHFVTHVEYESFVYVPQRAHGVGLAFAARGKGLYAWKTVTVPKGETWTSLSKKTGIPASVLKASNRDTSLEASARIRLPNSPHLRVPNFAQREAPARTQVATYKVQSGDTLLGIALKFDTTLTKMMQANNMSNASTLRVGQVLKIPGASAMPVAQRTPEKRTYVVKSGDTLGAIAQRHNLTTKELYELNKIKDANKLRVGDTLLVSSQ